MNDQPTNSGSPQDAASRLEDEYEQIIKMLVSMAVNAKKWTL